MILSAKIDQTSSKILRKLLKSGDLDKNDDGQIVLTDEAMEVVRLARLEWLNKQFCGRCLEEMLVSTCSMFDTEMICVDCELEERAHPEYVLAVEAEHETVKNGEMNFAGIGLPEDLKGKYKW